MNPELPTNPREAMELRITALLLGELPEGEAAAVREALAKDPELAKLHDDLKATIQLVRSAATKDVESIAVEAAQLKLSEARRKKLLTAFVIPPLKPSHRKTKPAFQFQLMEWVAVLAIVAAIAAISVAPIGVFRRETGSVTTSAEAVVAESASEVAFGMTQHDNLEQGRSGDSLGASNLYSLNIVGYTQVDPAQSGVAEQRIESSGLIPDPRGNVSFGGKSEKKSRADSEDYLKRSQRNLAAGQPPPAPVAPVAAPAPTQPQSQIVLPSLMVADTDGLADDGTRQKNRAVEEVALLASRLNSAGGIDHNGRGLDSSVSQKPWTISAALRGFYDNNANTVKEKELGSFGFEIASSRSPTALRDSFVAGGETDNLSVGDQTHIKADAALGENLAFGTFKSQDLGRGRVDSAEGKPGDVVAGTAFTPERFYRLSPGGGGGGGGAERGATVTLADEAAQVPAVGDTPVLGKLFVGKDALNRDGAVATDYFAASDFTPLPSQKAEGFSRLGRAITPDETVVAVMENKRSLVTGAEVMPGKSESESYAFNAGNFGAIALPTTPPGTVGSSEALPSRPSITSLGFLAADPNNLPPVAAEPTTPAYAGAEVSHRAFRERYGIARQAGVPVTGLQLSDDETKKDIAVQPAGPARQLNESLTAGLRGDGSERGRQLVQEGRLLLEAGRTDEAEAKLKSVLEADPKNPAAQYYLAFANEAKYRETNRARERASNDTAVKYERDVTPPTARKDSGRQLETRRFRVDKEALRQGIQSASDAGGAVVQGGSATGVPSVFVAGGSVPGASGDGGQRDRGGVRTLTRTNSADELQRGVRQFFSTAGVDLNANGKTVFFNDRTGELLVRGTKEDLAAIGEITQALAIKQPEVQADTPLPRKPATNAPVPQPEIQTSENNFSTFSLNVSDVSFKLAAASLEQGQMPDAGSVRSEEFINAFDYRDPEAAPGAPIAFAWERSRYPFAHNRDLLRFSLKTAAAGRQAGRPLNVVLLLDNSGSMERADRVQIIREALRVLAAQLQPQDKLSVITFARTPRLVADGIAGGKAGEVTEPVSELTPQGGTNLEEAMNLAYQTALRHYLAGGINRVVLLTDGAANLGNIEPDALKQKVEAHRKQGVALDAFGVGWEGFNDDLLEVLSRNGDGRYGFINSPEEAATEFAGQLAGALKVAASDVKVQVEFNPKRVTTYRQIGYAKHQLTKEQFRDNTVDAAEIAAQEAGNALYTVEVNPAGEGPLGTVRVRYKIAGTSDYREQAWDVPDTGAVAALEHSSPAMRLAASAGAFSEWLVASPFAGEVTPDRLLGYLSGVPEVYGADGRPKKLEWMIRQAKSLEGK